MLIARNRVRICIRLDRSCSAFADAEHDYERLGEIFSALLVLTFLFTLRCLNKFKSESYMFNYDEVYDVSSKHRTCASQPTSGWRQSLCL